MQENHSTHAGREMGREAGDLARGRVKAMYFDFSDFLCSLDIIIRYALILFYAFILVGQLGLRLGLGLFQSPFWSDFSVCFFMFPPSPLTPYPSPLIWLHYSLLTPHSSHAPLTLLHSSLLTPYSSHLTPHIHPSHCFRHT